MRIVSLQPSVSITLKALGRLDALCACTKYCVEALPELAEAEVTVLHDSWSADTAEIQAAQAGLVIASVPYRMESLAAILKSGVAVLALAPHSIADICNDIQLIAGAVDARMEGAAVIAGMRQKIAETREIAKGAGSRPLVYCEEWGKPLIHSQGWVAELVEAAGGEFLGEPGSHTTAEEIADAEPDVLVFAWCGAGNRVPLAKVIEQRRWGDLDGVKQGRVHCIPDELLNTPAPSLLDGLACLAGICQPELFRRDERVVTLRDSADATLFQQAMGQAAR